jgi:hypothetical protein
MKSCRTRERRRRGSGGQQSLAYLVRQLERCGNYAANSQRLALFSRMLSGTHAMEMHRVLRSISTKLYEDNDSSLPVHSAG